MAGQQPAGNAEPARDYYEINIGWFRLRLNGQAATIIATTGTFAIAGYCVYKVLNDKGLSDCIVYAITKGSVEIDIIAINEGAANLAKKILSSEDLLEWFNDALKEYSQLHNHVIGMFNDVKLVRNDVRKISQDDLLDIKKDAAALKKRYDDWLGEPLKEYVAGEFRNVVDAFANIGNRIRKMEEGKKTIFNDPVHGAIELSQKLVDIINTPQFQRLRNIKQLGGGYFVYPGASHNRFEHSIGTCYLAGKLIRQFQEQKQQKQLEAYWEITDEDVFCVELAGLCHDLGHGPFSHLFDNMYLPKVKKEANDEDTPTWKHEQGSCDMLKHLLDENDIRLDDKRHDEILEKVQKMIYPKNWEKTEKRGKKQRFLYQIISNEDNKVDVDKWDYFARDCHHLGLPNSFDHLRFMKFCRVLTLKEDGVTHDGVTIPAGSTTIGVHKKECKNLYEMFHFRTALHKRAYQHPVNKAIEMMIRDAMFKAKDQVEIPFTNRLGLSGEKLRQKDVAETEKLAKIDDSIFYTILHSSQAPQEAKDLLKRILKRNLYRCVGSVLHTVYKERKTQGERELSKTLDEWKFPVKDTSKVEIVEAKFDYGMNHKNPCDYFYFYEKVEGENQYKPIKIKKQEISEMLPDKFAEREVRVYSLGETEEEHKKIKDAFEEWKEKELKRANPFDCRTEHAMEQIICDELDKQESSIQRKRKIEETTILKTTFNPSNKEICIEMIFKVEDADVDAAENAFPLRK